MKIAQVCPGYFPQIGGVEEHVRNISERLARKYDVSVFTTDPSGRLPKEEIVNGVCVRRFKSWAPNGAYCLSSELRKYLRMNSDNCDVVHAHNYHAFPALCAAQTKGRNKLVFTPHYHGQGNTFVRSLLHVPYGFIGRRIFAKADNIICVSNYERDLLMKRFRVDEKKVVVIPNGINLEEFRDLKKRSENCRVILYVGRLEKYKGVQYLIKTLPMLSHNVILEIVGKGPYKENLVKLAKKLSVQSRVKLYQDLPRKDLLQKYANAVLFVLLSRHEAYGLSVAEALCAGTPCIVANKSALTEWVDGKSCFGIDYPINLDALADLIKEVAGKSVCKPTILDWDEVTDRLVRLYMVLISC